MSKSSAAAAARFTSDVEAAPLPDGRTVRKLADLATRQAQLEEWIAAYETVTQGLAKELKAIRERELPDAMALARVDEFKLAGGRKVSVREVYSAGIRTEWPEEHRARGFDYLVANNAGSLIKHDVAVTFGVGDAKWAASLLRYIKRQGWLSRFLVNDKTYVHPGTLAKWVRERLENDLPVDMEVLDAKVQRVSNVSAPSREVL